MFTDEHRKKAIEARRKNAALRAALNEGKSRHRQNTLNAGAVPIKLKMPEPHFKPSEQAVGVTPQYEVVTPSKAEKWLDANKGNRALREGLVEKYAKDMREGRWTTCTAPIVFYDDGAIADGQHRLWAIIESNCPQRFLIVRGLDRLSGLNIDMGKPRNLIDNAAIAGIDEGLTTTLLSLCRGIEQGDRASRYLTNSDKLRFVDKHREAARFAIMHGGRGRLFQNAIVNGAIARAWYHEDDKERLMRFGTVLSKGFGEGDADTAAIAMRNYIQAQGVRLSDSSEWKDLFAKIQNAIWYFMRGKKLTIIKGYSEERYPLKGAKK